MRATAEVMRVSRWGRVREGVDGWWAVDKIDPKLGPVAALMRTTMATKQGKAGATGNGEERS